MAAATIPPAGATFADSPRTPTASGAADYPEGLMLWMEHPLSTEEGADGADLRRPSIPVVALGTVGGIPQLVRTFDGVAESFANRSKLAAATMETAADWARRFTHRGASPSPRCSPSPPPSSAASAPPSPLGWLSAAGLARAGQATFVVPGRALRHIIGRGGATVRRLEALLGVLVGVVDGTGETASVSLVGPRERLAAAERLVRLVGQGHRSLLERLEERPGEWAVERAQEEREREAPQSDAGE